MGSTDHPPIEELHLLWMTAALGCDGDTIAVTGATQPSIEDVLTGGIPGIPKVTLYNQFLSYESGDDFLRPFELASEGRLGSFILVVEGSIPDETNKAEGYWAAMGTDRETGQPITTCEWIDRLAPHAWAVVAAGTCATYGGIHAMAGNPTGAMGLPDYLGWGWKSRADIPVVCVPGCPVQPDNFMSALLYLLHQAGGYAPMIPLDDCLRPRWLFNQTVHEGCDRAGYYEQGDFGTAYGSPKCIVKLGCWGPVVRCNVGKRGWMNGVGGCPNVGGICIGCTMPGFPDKFMPFMDEPPGAKLSSSAVLMYGRTVRALRNFTMGSLDQEPDWRRRGPYVEPNGAHAAPEEIIEAPPIAVSSDPPSGAEADGDLLTTKVAGQSWQAAYDILRDMAQVFSRPAGEAEQTPPAVEVRQAASAQAGEGRADARYRSLVEQIPAVTFIAQLAGDEIEFYVSPHIEALLGFSQQEWLSDPFLWFKQLHPGDRELCNREFARGCRTGGPFRAEFRALTRTGEVVWVRGEARMVREDGRPIFIQGVAYDITESKRAEEALRATAEQVKASLAEKEVLLREIHHRVKNNLQVISSLLKLQSSHVQDRAALELFNDSRNRIRSMALVHEKLYQSANLSRVDFNEYAEHLTALLVRSYATRVAPIRLNTMIDNVFLAIDVAVPLGLIINELISNSLKYAFPAGRGGEVRLELRQSSGDDYELIVADDGIGFPQHVDFRETETLGMQLVHALTKQIGGSIELSAHGGTEFRICFPG